MNKKPQIEKLSKEDIKFLRAAFVQILLVYIAVIFVAVVVYFGSYLIIMKSTVIEDKHTAILLLTALFVVGFIFSLYLGINKPLMDILSGKKIVQEGEVSSKSIRTRHAFGQKVVDYARQPTLIEYFITVDENTYFIEEQQFNRLNEKDKVLISFSSETHRILDIEKTTN